MDETVQRARMIAERMAAGRKMAELSIAKLVEGTPIHPDRLALIEGGLELPSSRDIAFVAQATDLPISWFMEDRPPLVASRKADAEGGTSPKFDLHLERLAMLVEQLLIKGVLSPSSREVFALRYGMDEAIDHDYAADVASKIRERAGAGVTPIKNLTKFCEGFGLLAFSGNYIGAPFEGALTEVSVEEQPLGVALIATQPGSIRPRFTLAHELGHWIFDTIFEDGCGHSTIERYMNSFAAHLLMPADYVRMLSEEGFGASARALAMAVSAQCGVSWKATLGHLEHLGFISAEDYALQIGNKPKLDEFRRNGFEIPLVDDLTPVPPAYRESVLTAYQRRVITEGKAIEALFYSASAEELPPRDKKRGEMAS